MPIFFLLHYLLEHQEPESYLSSNFFVRVWISKASQFILPPLLILMIHKLLKYQCGALDPNASTHRYDLIFTACLIFIRHQIDDQILARTLTL